MRHNACKNPTQGEGSHQLPRGAFVTLQKRSQVAGEMGAALPGCCRQSWEEMGANHLVLFHPFWHLLVPCQKVWAPTRHLKLPESLEKPDSSIASLWPLGTKLSAPSLKHHGPSLLVSVPADKVPGFPFSISEISPKWFPSQTSQSFGFPRRLLGFSRILLTY